MAMLNVINYTKRSMIAVRLLSTITVLLSAICPSVAATDHCPKQCTCLSTGSEVRVKCTGPFDGLPTGIPTSTTSLILSGDGRVDAIIASIHRDTFHNLTLLQELNLKNVRLRTLHSESFRKLEHLSKLVVTDNEIDTLPPSLFVNLRKLVFVDFSNNRIEELPGDLLLLPRLAVLSLKNNKIHNLSRGVFENVATLQLLDISGNPLEHIEAETFKGLPRLRTIRMNNCSFTEINNYLLYYLDKITTIELKDNKLSKMDATLFNTTVRLKELHLDGNDIIYLEPGFLRGVNLRSLGLSRNKIVSISIGAFQQFTTEILKLNDNWIKYVPPALFRHMNETLKFLYLAGNPLTNIQKSTFYGLPRLRTLDVSRTRISSLPVDMFAGLELQFVNLSRNNFSSFDNETLTRTLRPVDLVDLHDNPWECTCYVRPLRRWLLENSYGQNCPAEGSVIHPFKSFVEMRSEFNCLVCGDYPSVHSGKLVKNLTADETEQCVYVDEPKITTIPVPIVPSAISVVEIVLLVIAAILLLAIIVLIAVCCYLRKLSKRQEYDLQQSVTAQPASHHSHWSNFPGSPEVASDAAWGNPELWSIESIDCLDAAKLPKKIAESNGAVSMHFDSAYYNPSAKPSIARLERDCS